MEGVAHNSNIGLSNGKIFGLFVCGECVHGRCLEWFEVE